MLSIRLESNFWAWCESAITLKKKVLAIPQIAASETGTAQTERIYMFGVVGQNQHLVAESYKIDI